MTRSQIFLSFLTIVCLIFASQVEYASAWQIETVTSSGVVGKYSSLAVDSLKKIHIAYFDDTNNEYKVKYVTNASGSWQTETVDAVYVGELNSISLTIDSSDKVHISYLDWSNEDLKYATNKSGMWQTEIVDSLDRPGCWNSIAVDSSGKVHISYFETRYNVLKYATNSSGSWHIETIDSPNSGRYSSIAVDSSDNIHISYQADYHLLRYATNASGLWVISTIDTSDNSGYDTSIAVDSSGKVHISYCTDLSSDLFHDLKYASNVTGSWLIETIDGNTTGRYSCIAVDSLGKVHISYFDNGNRDLKYATKDSGVWITSTIDSIGDVGMYTSLAVDSSNNIHVSYYDFGNYDLKYAFGNTTAYNLSVTNVTGSGSVSATDIDCPSDCSENYYSGTNVELTAISNTGWYFDSWGGDISGSTNPYTLLIDSDKNITATFKEIDTDSDGVPDSEDNCPQISNPNQADMDKDGIGDVCDNDADGDGFVKGVDCNDLNPLINPLACDIRNDGIDQNCDGVDRTKGQPCVGEADGDLKELACADGIDNDKDGLIDCADPDCARKKECR